VSAPTAAQLQSLDEYFSEEAGPNARDCGLLPPFPDFFKLSPALQCVRRANSQHEPFRLVLYSSPLDAGPSASGLAGRGDGVIRRFVQSAIRCPGTPCVGNFWFKTEIFTHPRVGLQRIECDAAPNPVR